MPNLPTIAARSCSLALGALNLELRPSGAAYALDQSLLIVADLHLEKGSHYAARTGQFLPPFDSLATLDRLAAEIAALQPRRIVVAGDAFHDGEGFARLPEAARARLLALTRQSAFTWIAGNHDPLLPADLHGAAAEEMVLEGVTLTHAPRAAFVGAEIAGHLHPAVAVSAYGRRVRRRCFAADDKRLILPAFGAYAGGLDVEDPAFAPLFSTGFTAFALGARSVQPVRRIGPRPLRALQSRQPPRTE